MAAESLLQVITNDICKKIEYWIGMDKLLVEEARLVTPLKLGNVHFGIPEHMYFRKLGLR